MHPFPFTCVVVCLLAAPTARPASTPNAEPPPPDLSLRHEVQRAIDRGLTWLLDHQHTNGWWSTPDHPAVTALALTAFRTEPTDRYRHPPHPALTRATDYLLSCVQADGSIHRGKLVNYNTAISTVALALLDQPAHRETLRRSRAFLIRSQNDFGTPGRLDTPLDGGVGYGDKYQHADLNNTLAALEALRATDPLVRDQPPDVATRLNWDAAIRFIQNCQNLPGHNPADWVSSDAEDRGGFVYYPGHSMAGSITNPATGRVALRSYGTISYAGLLSYLHARLTPDDPRVIAVLDWLRRHYTLDENPGMGQQGLFYYLHLLTKTLSVAQIDTLDLRNGQRHPWRRDVALRLLQLQRPDGSWLNPNPRWWENDPHLVTAYAVLSLNLLWRGL